jgi:hypothetical protein
MTELNLKTTKTYMGQECIEGGFVYGTKCFDMVILVSGNKRMPRSLGVQGRLSNIYALQSVGLLPSGTVTICTEGYAPGAYDYWIK